MNEALTDGFAKLHGRQPSQEERDRLQRVKEALGLQSNDAVWLIFFALDYYDALYQRYPVRIEEAARKAVGEVTGAVQIAARAEMAKAHRSLAEAVAAASSAVAAKRAEAVRWMSWAWVVAALVLFGAFAMVCGFEMGRGALPFWMAREVATSGGALVKVLGAVLGAPAGWMAFALLLPVAGWWARRGWRLTHDEGEGQGLRGWAILGGALATVVFCAVALARLAPGFGR